VRVNELLEARAVDMPRKEALVYAGERFTYAQLDEAAGRVAHLPARGRRPQR
jgi:acyl-CoA synthetase (AMP-forming)/AMP-acid ligase II